MTPDDPLTVLLDRACRALSPDEAAALRAAVHQLRQQSRVDTAVWCLREELEQTEAIYLAASRRVDRYRAAWHSARRRARYIPEAGQEIHDGTRWRPALQAYSVLRARLARAEQELAALCGQTPQPAEPRTHQADIRVDDDGERNVSCPDCPAYIDNIGDEDDANEWAEQHRAEATSSQAPR